MKQDFDLYFITDRRLSKKPVKETVKGALEGGVKLVQYREKEFPAKKMVEEAKELKRLCTGHGALFLVNDRVDVALASGADGVHLGQEDMELREARKILGENKVIGVTAHNAAEAREAEESGADYVSASPVFETATKEDAGRAGGIELLKEVKNAVSIPVTAIGGINEENLSLVLEAGVKKVSMISAVLMQEDVKGAVERIRGKLK